MINGEFDLDNASYGISWYMEDSCEYDFSEEQMKTIKENVSKYIVSNNLGKIKDRKKDLLKKVCDYTDNKVNSNELKIKYDIDLKLNICNGIYIVESTTPLMVSLKNGIVKCVNGFRFTKNNKGEFEIASIQTLENEMLIPESVDTIIGIGNLEKLVYECSKICQENDFSFIKVKDKCYKINSIIDFLKMNYLEEVNIDDMDYNFTFKEQDLLYNIMDNSSSVKFREILTALRYKMIISEDEAFVAKAYLRRVLGLTGKELKYMDYIEYFKNEVSHEIIDGYTVVFI